CQQYKSAPWTF
nr:immunoglobulin light chain junction region [Macaca mulatta]MOW63355.1 immunoglobulin light chain junction region [Macaca mulatta]